MINKKYFKLIKQAIKKDTLITRPCVNLLKILKLNGYENYYELCKNNIVDNGISNYISINRDEYLLLTLDGLRHNKEILEGYIAQDKLKEIEEYLKQEENTVETFNIIIKNIKRNSTKELISNIYLLSKTKELDSIQLKSIYMYELRKRFCII